MTEPLKQMHENKLKINHHCLSLQDIYSVLLTTELTKSASYFHFLVFSGSVRYKPSCFMWRTGE